MLHLGIYYQVYWRDSYFCFHSLTRTEALGAWLKKTRRSAKSQNTTDEKSRSRRTNSKKKRPFYRNPLLWIGVIAVVASVLYFTRLFNSENEAPVLSPEIVRSFPHDTTAFTQGLLIEEGQLYESTGQYGESSVRRIDLRTGETRQIHELDESFFGEGLAVLNGRMYQLTWKEQRCFVYDVASFELLDTLTLPTREGWGLTEDGQHLIMSDGSSALRFLDPETLAVVREVEVRNGGRPVSQLNELEYIEGLVYANIWQSGYIAVIDPNDGTVKRLLDLSWFSKVHGIDGADVLNGIAYEPTSKRLLVTGKFWPKYYVLELPAVD